MAPNLKDPAVGDFPWATKAARNNAEWCDLVCRSHGAPGEFYDDMWINKRATPRFYPNAVTLSCSNPTGQYDIIRELIRMQIPGDWAVKDSFDALDLASDGFHELLTGEWIRWSMPSEIPKACVPGISWRKVEDPAELAAWEDSWRGISQEGSPVFMPELLEVDKVAFIGAFRGNRIVAGCIGNRSQDGVGISNIFLPDERRGEFRSGCVAEILRWSEELPLMGYESGDDLVAMRFLGFESVGRLQVWVRRNEQRV